MSILTVRETLDTDKAGPSGLPRQLSTLPPCQVSNPCTYWRPLRSQFQIKWNTALKK